MLVIILSQKYLCQTLRFKNKFVFFITDYKLIDVFSLADRCLQCPVAPGSATLTSLVSI